LYTEDENHILRCRILSRQKIRDKWRSEIINFLSEQHTPPPIRYAICHGFFSWLESGRNTQDIPPLPYRNVEVMKVYDNQMDIGWQHFARGRMVIEWGTMINDHLATQCQYNFNAEHWGSKLLSINWKYILELWELRNKELHGEAPEKAVSIRRQQMIDEILHIQNTHTHLSLSDRELINRDIILLQAMTTSSLTAYLYGARTVVETARQHPRVTGQQRIQKFFQPRQHKGNDQRNHDT
jgi:hypothetical protein